MTIAEILKNSNFKLTQFNLVEIQNLENRITTKEDRGNETPYIKCLVRKKDIKLTPEEAVRQLYIQVLIDDYDYPVERMEIEYSVSFGREKKRADIVIFDKQKTTSPYIMVELKKPKLKDGKEQLLDLAKTVVEKAIEANEEKAMEYVNNSLNRILKD